MWQREWPKLPTTLGISPKCAPLPLSTKMIATSAAWYHLLMTKMFATILFKHRIRREAMCVSSKTCVTLLIADLIRTESGFRYGILGMWFKYQGAGPTNAAKCGKVAGRHF